MMGYCYVCGKFTMVSRKVVPDRSARGDIEVTLCAFHLEHYNFARPHTSPYY